eukprot:6191597-Pleurochrysis_carterae.AAC.4
MGFKKACAYHRRHRARIVAVRKHEALLVEHLRTCGLAHVKREVPEAHTSWRSRSNLYTDGNAEEGKKCAPSRPSTESITLREKVTVRQANDKP